MAEIALSLSVLPTGKRIIILLSSVRVQNALAVVGAKGGAELIEQKRMSEFEFCEFLRDIAYKNGAGDKRALRAEWLRGIELMNLSFYDRANGDDGDELIFAEDFDLQTTIKLRDWLTEIINAAAIIADQAENAASCEFGEAAPTSHENK